MEDNIYELKCEVGRLANEFYYMKNPNSDLPH